MKLFLLFFSLNCFAASTLTQINVTGDKEATLEFNGVNEEPTVQWHSNIMELTFSNAALEAKAEGKLDLSSPHPLIKRVSAFQNEKDGLRVNVVVNGSLEDIKERMKWAKTANGVTLKYAYPKGDTSFLDSLKEEEIPLTQVQKAVPSKTEKGMGVTSVVFSVFALVVFIVAGFFSVKFLKSKGGLKGLRGTRKFLIENLSYCQLGPKMGVSLVKVGEEFVLLGVTPNNISLLSSLPQLRNQYLEETKFERNVFKQAVEEEFNRMNA